MPIPNPIRKEILAALENHIIPALWQRKVPLGYVTPALLFPPDISTRVICKTVPRPDAENPDYPTQTRWTRAKLHATFFPYIGFIYEGSADERTVVTAAQAAKYHLVRGIYAIRWQAPGVLIFPPGTPRNGGDTDLWQSDEPPPPQMKILWLSVWSEISIHTHLKDVGTPRRISHSLQVNDRQAIALAGLFLEEAKTTTANEQDTARAILLAIMLRLQKSLRHGPPKIANTSRSPLPLPEAIPPSESAARMCRNAAIFIQMRLHESLSLPRIAQEVGLSTAHLNRLFRRTYGLTVMNYVRGQRIAAAKKILAAGPENIAEIAALVGFKRTSAFCDVFRRETGLTPNQFRRQARRASTPPRLHVPLSE
jgi:AraC-like DNA-binding protein